MIDKNEKKKKKTKNETFYFVWIIMWFVLFFCILFLVFWVKDETAFFNEDSFLDLSRILTWFLLLTLPHSFRPRTDVTFRVPFMGQTELFENDSYSIDSIY